MSDDTTTTDATASEGVDAANVTAPAQPEQAESAEAVQQTESSNTNANESSSDVIEWASKKGLELNADNPNEVKLANMQREAEKKMHESTAQASELKNVINEEVSRAGVPEDVTAQLQQQLQAVQAHQAVNDFYAANPDAREYDAAMAKIAQENPGAANAGIEALYALAKVRDLEAGGTEQLKGEGKKEALQDLALKQKVASATASATTKQTSTSEISREDVQQALANHDVDWLRKNRAAIDAL